MLGNIRTLLGRAHQAIGALTCDPLVFFTAPSYFGRVEINRGYPVLVPLVHRHAWGREAGGESFDIAPRFPVFIDPARGEQYCALAFGKRDFYR